MARGSLKGTRNPSAALVSRITKIRVTEAQEPCKFGYSCQRTDCIFFHAEGRVIDEQDTSTPSDKGACKFWPQVTKVPVVSSTQLCKFGFKCQRPDCFYDHPEGRQIDSLDQGGGGEIDDDSLNSLLAEVDAFIQEN